MQVDAHNFQDRLREAIVGNSKHAKDWRQDADSYMEDKIKNAVKEAARKLPGGKITSSRTRIRLTFAVDIDCEGETKTAQLCETCFVSLCNHNAKRWVEEQKQTHKRKHFEDKVMADLRESCHKKLSGKIEKDGAFHNAPGKRCNILEVRKAMMGTLNLTEEQLHLLVVGGDERSREAYYWMRDFFQLVCDKAPVKDNLCQVPGVYTKQAIYQIFNTWALLQTGREDDPLGQSAWQDLWIRVFPNVKIAKYVIVGGKCRQCHLLYQRLEYFKTNKDLVTTKKLMGDAERI
jgi:hypothetical protein